MTEKERRLMLSRIQGHNAWQQRQRANLDAITGVGGGPSHQWGAGGIPQPNYQQAMGAVSHQYGQRSNEHQLDRFMYPAGTPGMRPVRAAARTAPAIPQPPDDIETLRDQLAREQARQQKRYEFDQQQRYNDVIGGKQAIRDRVLGGLDGQGQAAELQLREDSKNDIERQRSYLIERGLAGSTILPAFMQENSRQLNLQLQGQRERRAQQMADLDAKLSGSVYDAMERRQDKPPDNSLLSQLEAKLGAAAALKAQPTPSPARQRAPRIPFQGGVSASTAARMAQSFGGGFNPLATAQGMLGGLVMPGMAAIAQHNYQPAQQNAPTQQSEEPVGADGTPMTLGEYVYNNPDGGPILSRSEKRHYDSVQAYQQHKADMAAGKRSRLKKRMQTYVPASARPLY